MKERIKILASNESVGEKTCGFVKVVKFESIGKKFKISNSTGNCYCRSEICVMLPTLAWAVVADGFDFAAPHIHYFAYEKEKKEAMAEIYEKAIKYITNVYIKD